MRLKSIVLVLLLLVFASTASAANYTDLGGDHLWSNPDNWDPVGILPGSGDKAAMQDNGTICLIDDPMVAEAKSIQVGLLGAYCTLNIDGGTVDAQFINAGRGGNTTAQWGSYGVINMSGGSVNLTGGFEVPSQFAGKLAKPDYSPIDGEFTMTGGTLVASVLSIGKSGGVGTVTFSDGLMQITNALGGLSINASVVGDDGVTYGGTDGQMTISGNARLEIAGDHIATLNQYITDGWLVNNTGQAPTIDGSGTTIIPEPATLILLGLGGLILRRRR